MNSFVNGVNVLRKNLNIHQYNKLEQRNIKFLGKKDLLNEDRNMDLSDRPRWFSPGMIFLGFLARSPHLQLLTEDEYKKLMTEMPVALKALRGNTLNNQDSSIIKGKFTLN
jgi:hypothetical protein